jgi:serine/threonine protein kinase
MYDAGLPAPEPFGFVEITPEREYMIVMQFFDDAVEISEADVDDPVIDEGLDLVRRMWDLGLAHRDVKPANLMVQAGHLRLIDVFFVQVRPSPWRQAVDLANMMMVLALRTDAPRVYEHALLRFSPDEIAEAFAATRGVASPTQLRSMMKAQGRDLLAEFRALALAREPIKIQRWSVRRIALTAWVLFGAFVVVTFIAGNWTVFT